DEGGRIPGRIAQAGAHAVGGAIVERTRLPAHLVFVVGLARQRQGQAAPAPRQRGVRVYRLLPHLDRAGERRRGIPSGTALDVVAGRGHVDVALQDLGLVQPRRLGEGGGRLPQRVVVPLAVQGEQAFDVRLGLAGRGPTRAQVAQGGIAQGDLDRVAARRARRRALRAG